MVLCDRNQQAALGPIDCGTDARHLLRRLTLILLITGIGWRTLRYLLHFPLWGDEAMLCLNFLELDYAGLARELRYCQVAPILFLWGELTVLRLLGGSALALRLLPFLAGLAALLLFGRLCRLTLPPLARTLAFGFLAVAIWPVSMATCAKPYAFDLFMALLLLVPAAQWLREPRRLRSLVLLILATPAAVLGSYPVVFVGGGISLGLLPAAWRGGRSTRWLWLAYNAALVGTFVGNVLIVGAGQLQTRCGNGATTTEAGMERYWAEGFPPATPAAFVKWLFLAHTGQMAAYPIGAADGGSTLTAILCLVGAWRLGRSRQWSWLTICTVPFALWLLAALLHRYPYAASCRLSQHVAPIVCLTAGLGSAALLERIASAERQRRWLIGVGAAFLAIAAGGIGRDLLKPYHDRQAVWARQALRDLAEEVPPGCPLVVFNAEEEVDELVRWHFKLLGRDRLLFWNDGIDWNEAAAHGQLVVLHYRHGPQPRKPAPPVSLAELPDGPPLSQHWALTTAATTASNPSTAEDHILYLDRSHWLLER
jgi:hypothetical protein